MARRYKVEGTRDYLVGAIVLFALGLWAVRDGWYPAASVLERHPKVVIVSFKTGGVVEEVLTKPGRWVAEGQPLMRLKKPDLTQEIKATEAAQIRLREEGDAASPGVRAEAEAAKAALQAARDRAQTAELVSPVIGQIQSVEADRFSVLSAGDPVIRIQPKTSFYLFNKSLSVLAFLGALASFLFHRLAK